ncbi:MAG: hypothetical protein JXQ29_18910 [Planctomycetes bacterium]|nr:hypothetical protein [Planctomycetota bacterium]
MSTPYGPDWSPTRSALLEEMRDEVFGQDLGTPVEEWLQREVARREAGEERTGQ